jgi:hypothetical protein
MPDDMLGGLYPLGHHYHARSVNLLYGVLGFAEAYSVIVL